jgi:hypothetical protein
MSALSAIEAPVLTGTVVPAPADTGERRQQQRLRLAVPPAAGRPHASTSAVGQPCASSIGKCQTRGKAASEPVRLTRRGRIVLAALAIGCVTAVVLVVSLLASGGAQASNHGQPGAPYQGMHQIVVQRGQTLWSIASAAEPTADPRTVIQQIMSVNALSGPGIQVGQLLWVPR